MYSKQWNIPEFEKTIYRIANHSFSRFSESHISGSFSAKISAPVLIFFLREDIATDNVIYITQYSTITYIYGLAQDCGNSSA